MKTFYKKFTSKIALYQAIEEISSCLDLEKMISFLKEGNPNRYYVFPKYGEKIICNNTKHFFSVINRLSSKEFIESMCYNTSPNEIHVYAKEDYFSLSVKSPVVVEEDVTVIDDQPEVKVLLHAKSLYNKEDKIGCKSELAAYASKFNIELNKNKKFSRMIIDFEKELNLLS